MQAAADRHNEVVVEALVAGDAAPEEQEEMAEAVAVETPIVGHRGPEAATMTRVGRRLRNPAPTRAAQALRLAGSAPAATDDLPPPLIQESDDEDGPEDVVHPESDGEHDEATIGLVAQGGMPKTVAESFVSLYKLFLMVSLSAWRRQR